MELPFGLQDLPARQEQRVATFDPAADGHLLVIGAQRCGTTYLHTMLDAHEQVTATTLATSFSVNIENIVVSRTNDTSAQVEVDVRRSAQIRAPGATPTTPVVLSRAATVPATCVP